MTTLPFVFVRCPLQRTMIAIEKCMQTHKKRGCMSSECAPRCELAMKRLARGKQS